MLLAISVVDIFVLPLYLCVWLQKPKDPYLSPMTDNGSTPDGIQGPKSLLYVCALKLT